MFAWVVQMWTQFVSVCRRMILADYRQRMSEWWSGALARAQTAVCRLIVFAHSRLWAKTSWKCRCKRQKYLWNLLLHLTSLPIKNHKINSSTFWRLHQATYTGMQAKSNFKKLPLNQWGGWFVHWTVWDKGSDWDQMKDVQLRGSYRTELSYRTPTVSLFSSHLRHLQGDTILIYLQPCTVQYIVILIVDVAPYNC